MKGNNYVLRVGNSEMFYSGIGNDKRINLARKWNESSLKPSINAVRCSTYEWWRISENGILEKVVDLHEPYINE